MMKKKYFLTFFIVINTLAACSSYTKSERTLNEVITKEVGRQEGKYERLQRENYTSIERELRSPAQQGTEVYVKNLVMDLVLKLAPFAEESVVVDSSAIKNTSYATIKKDKIEMLISLFYKELTEFGISVAEKNSENDDTKTVLEIKLSKENHEYNIICFIKKNNSDIVYHVIVASLPSHLIENTKDGIPNYL